VVGVLWSFDAVAYIAPRYVLLYSSIHGRPTNVARFEIRSSESFKVTGLRVIVETTYYYGE
jgi:hypothetical protein